MSLLSLYSKIQLKIGKTEERCHCEEERRSNPVTTRRELDHGIAASAFLSLRSFSLLAMTMWRKNKNFCSLLFWKTAKVVVRFFALLFNDSSENFLMFASEYKAKRLRSPKGTMEPVFTFVCNNSYSQYKKFQKRVRFYSKTAFAGVLVCTIITSSILYFMMPGKPTGFAATSTWTQTDWSGGADTVNFPVHPTNQTGWGKYYEKDDDIITGDTLTLASSGGTSWTETSSSDFSDGTFASVTGHEGNLFLGSPDGTIYYKEITVTNPNAEELTDFQIKITFDSASLIGGNPSKMQSDCDDLRFTDSDNKQELNYWIRSSTCNSASTEVWVKIPSIPASSSKYIYMYYGNPNISSKSSGSNTFVWFDDFSGSHTWTGTGDTYSSTNEGYIRSIRDTAGTATSTLTSEIIGSGTYTLNVKEKSYNSNNIANYYLIQKNSAGETNLGNAIYADYTENSYAISGTDIQIKIKTEDTIVSGDDSTLYGNTCCCMYGVCGGDCVDGCVNSSPSCPTGYISTTTCIVGGMCIQQPFSLCARETVCTRISSSESKGWIDDILIRKSVASDPTVSVSSTENAVNNTSGTYVSSGHDTQISSIIFENLTFNKTDSSAWSYKLPITITNNESSDLTSYQIPLTINTQALISGGKINSDGSDIRFQTQDGTSIPYYIESGINTSSTSIRIKIPTLPADGATIYMYYGNPSAVPISDPENVFEFFDDFSLTSTEWTGTGTYSVASPEGTASASKNGTGSEISTLATTSAFGSGNFKVDLDVKNSGSASGSASYTNKVQYVNDSGTTDSDSASYSIYTEKTYDLNGNNIKLKINSESVGYSTSSAVSCGPHWGGPCTPSCSGTITDGSCGICVPPEGFCCSGTCTINYLATSQIWIDNVKVYKSTTNEPSAVNGTEESGTYLGGTIKFQIRAAPTEGGLSSATWYGPTGISDYYTTSDTAINSIHNNNGWVQYKAILETADPTQTPSLHDTTISFGMSSALTSSPYDASDSGQVISQIAWTETIPADTNVKFQMRTAPESSGTYTIWMGPDGTADTYFDEGSSGCSKTGSDVTCDVLNTLGISDGVDDRWMQYKVWLTSSTAETPVLSDVSIQYVVNANPVVSNVTASQGADGVVSISYDLSDADSSSFTVSALADIGVTLNEELTNSDITAITVSDASLLPDSGTIQIEDEQISYTSKLGNDLQGTITRGINNTVARSHSSVTAIWIKGSTVTGNVGASQTAGTGKSISWTIKTDLDGVYHATAKIRVSANDGNGANQVGNSDSVAFVLDTKDPTLGSPVFKINPNLDANNLFDISSSDDTVLAADGFMRFANASNINGSTCSDDISSAVYESFSTTKTWTLSPDADSVSTVCIQTKDKYDNQSSIGFIAIPPKPSSMMIQDNSSVGLNQYRMFVTWKDYTGTDWANYTLQRSDDNVTFSALTILSSDKIINFYTDATTVLNQTYYYKVYTENANGSISFYSDTIQGNANGIQDFGEGGGGTEGDPPVITHSYIEKTTSSTQTSIKLFWSDDVALTAFNHYEIWYGEDLTDVQNRSGTAIEWDDSDDSNLLIETTTSTTITGLSGSTTYYFKVWAVDEDASSGVPTSMAEVESTTTTISFTTDSLSDSFVGYSTDLNYTNEQGLLTVIGSGNAHSVTIVGLSENTTYYYRMRSANGSGINGYLPLSNATTAEKQKYLFTTTTDTDPPIITFTSSTDITNVTDSSAVISWTTDEAATSLVDYGTDTSYGSNEANANYNVDHSITLSSLLPETTYYFKLTSVDDSISNNSATDDNSTAGYTFTTLASSDSTPPVISTVSSGTPLYNTATITWTTDENSSSLVDFGTDTNYGTTQGNSADSTTSHSIVLTGLASDTTYYYRVKSMDVSGNTAVDDNSEAGWTFLTTSASEGDTAPVISSVSSSSVTSTSATISWTTDESSDSTVGFSLDTSFNTEQGATALTTSHSIDLINLAPETTYYYQVKSRDAAGNLGTDNNAEIGYSFTTLAGGDALAPIISDVTISDLTANTAKITWTTNENSNSLVDYSGTSGVFTSTAGQYQDNTISHTVTLRGLDPSTAYYLQARSADASGNEGKDSNGGTGYIFTTTAGGDETPPEITNIAAGTPTYSSVTITWATNELSSSLVDFGTSTSYGTTQGNSADSVTSHSVTLTGLTPSTAYYYRVKSIDTSGNLVSDDNSGAGHTFTTAAGADLGDATAPVITFDSSAGITNITSNSATIAWTTDESSDSIIGYGLDTSFNSEKGLATLVTSHSVTLTNLSSGTAYKFQLKSMDESGNLATENNGGAGYTFTTLAGGDSTAPIVSSVSTGTCADTYCVVLWTTDENSSSLVDYGTVQGTYVSTGGNYKDEVTAHSVTLTSLTPETTYYYRVRSVDANDNQALDAGGTDGYSLTTTAAAESECPACPSCGGGGSCPSTDTNPPTISNVTVSAITTNSVVVKWETNENGYSLVEYGLDNFYGSVNGSATASAKNHTVALTKLDENTTHHYRILSADSSGNLAQSEDLTFKTVTFDELSPEDQEEQTSELNETTAAEIQTKIEELLVQGIDEEEIRIIIARASEPPVISTEGPLVENVTNSSAKVVWITDRKSNSVIRFKAEEEGIDPETSSSLKQYGNFKELTVEHQVILASLNSGTSYQYQVQSSDVLGNTSKSDWHEFFTEVTPSIYDVVISEITLNSAVISWKTNVVTSSKVEYGETISYTDSIEDKGLSKVAKHSIKLNNLRSGTLYHFRVRGISGEGNSLVSDDYSFTTFTLPQIENYQIEEIDERTIRLNWKTNVETDSTLKYTDLETNITKTQGEDGMSSIHNFILKGLNPGKEYLLQIQGRDIYGNQAITSEFTATTLADNTAPEIKQIRTETAVSSGKSDVVQTIISWKTNEPTTSQILWEEGISQDEEPQNSTPEDENYTTNHIMVITTFKPASVYRFRIQGEDKTGNIGQSQDFTILIPEKKKSVIQIIISNFEDTFGWVKKIGL